MAAQPLADTPPDNRRITEHDPAVVALKETTARKLQASVNRLIRDLRPGSGVPQGEAQSQFIQRHVAILRNAYVEAHRLGQRQYFDGVSRDAGRWAREEPDAARMARTLAFYAPSVAKIAHEAAVYAAAAHTHRALTRMAALAEVETMFGPPVSELPEPQEDGQYSLDELDELRRLDALPEFAVDEDGADESGSYKLFNPNHDARGRFAPGSGGGSHGAAQHAGGGHIGAHLGAARGAGAYGGLGFAHHASGGGGGTAGASDKAPKARAEKRLSLAQYKAERAAAQAAGDKERVRALAKQYPAHQNRVNKERQNANKPESEFMKGFKARQAEAQHAAAKANSLYYYHTRQDYLREDVMSGAHRLATYKAFRGQMLKAIAAEDHEYVRVLNGKYRSYSHKLRAENPEVERAVKAARRHYKNNHPSNSHAARQASKAYKAAHPRRIAGKGGA